MAGQTGGALRLSCLFLCLFLLDKQKKEVIKNLPGDKQKKEEIKNKISK